MAIPPVPAVPNPPSTTFAADALAFTQWMAAAAPEFDAAASDANQAVTDAEQAVVDAATQVGLATTQAGLAATQAGLAATQAGYASGHATAADTARSNAVIAKDAAEDARDLAQSFAEAATAAVGLPPDLSTVPGGFVRVNGAGDGLEATTDVPAGSVAHALKTSAYTLLATDKGALVDCKGTWTLGADAGIAAGWWAYIRNAANGDITIDPAGATTIAGAATHVLKPGFTVLLVRNAGGFEVVTVQERSYSTMQLITSNTSWIVPAGMYVLRAYAVGKGGDGTTTASGGGAGMAFGDIAVTPGATVSISFAAGVAKVTVGGVDLLTANPASGVTAGTASKHASVTNGGAYSGGAGAAAAGRGGASSGSPLGAGVATGAGTGGAGWGGAGSGVGGGGGVGGAAVNQGGGGPGLRMEDMMTEPLLSRLISPGVINRATTSSGVDGGPGAGGAPNSSPGIPTGNGGFGAGGAAAAATAGLKGGLGGFGGGGGCGSSSATPGDGGNGGHGGGGGAPGASGAAGGVGGAAAVLLMY